MHESKHCPLPEYYQIKEPLLLSVAIENASIFHGFIFETGLLFLVVKDVRIILPEWALTLSKM